MKHTVTPKTRYFVYHTDSPALTFLWCQLQDNKGQKNSLWSAESSRFYPSRWKVSGAHCFDSDNENSYTSNSRKTLVKFRVDHYNCITYARLTQDVWNI